MNIRGYLAWSSVVSAVLAAPSLLNTERVGDEQRPVGTSFGVPGSSSKFDYVVCLVTLCSVYI